MTINECYACMGADYGDVLRRMGKAERVAKFLAMFPDEPSYGLLCSALAQGNAQEAFRAAHSLKGVCMNLGLSSLGDTASKMTEALRGGLLPADVGALLDEVDGRYRETVSCIRAFMQG